MKNQVYIDGRWLDSNSDQTISVFNPTTGGVIATIPAGNLIDANLAVDAAYRAFPAWSKKTPNERADLINRVADLLLAKSDVLAEMITSEVGMPLKLSKIIQVGNAIDSWKNYAQIAREFKYEESVGNSLLIHDPIGVVACITPWNFPLIQIAHKIAPALAAGCTVILKPSELAPLNAIALAEIIHEAGFPPGVFNLLMGTGQDVGEVLVSHPKVDMVSFTGSTRAGKRVGAIASQSIKRVALELGGKSSSVVLDDADFTKAIKGTLNSCFLNSGQTCLAHTRLLIPENKYDEAKAIVLAAVEKMKIGDPFVDGTRLGPVISSDQRDRIRNFIATAKNEGAEVITGEEEIPNELLSGNFVQPTVLGRVQVNDTVAQEEIFGPVLSIITYKDEAEAIGIANNTIYGLGGGVWSNDFDRAMKFARQMRTGQVDINGAPFNTLAPFGGYKQSGNGREYGLHGFKEFFEIKSIQQEIQK
ncbi:MAG: aldehyde dehydrogenase family protein [Polynucleobacter sp.]